MPSYGLVVEGSYDAGVYEILVSRLAPPGTVIVVRETGGVPRLRRLFPTLLRDLEQAIDGGPVDRALVIRDADGKNPAALEAEMRARIVGEVFAFPRSVDWHVVVQAVETWLLADIEAVNAVALARNGSAIDVAGRLPLNLETLLPPKPLFSRFLFEAGLPYTAQVCREIAEKVDLRVLRERCPGFRQFEAKVVRT